MRDKCKILKEAIQNTAGLGVHRITMSMHVQERKKDKIDSSFEYFDITCPWPFYDRHSNIVDILHRLYRRVEKSKKTTFEVSAPSQTINHLFGGNEVLDIRQPSQIFSLLLHVNVIRYEDGQGGVDSSLLQVSLQQDL